MADKIPSENAPASQEVAPPASQQPAPNSRPEPPPYRPDKDLIGYVERGQKPPAPRQPPPTENR
jgi:hypothetical protein